MNELEIGLLKKMIKLNLEYEWQQSRHIHSEYPEYSEPEMKDFIYIPNNIDEMLICNKLIQLKLAKPCELGFVLDME